VVDIVEAERIAAPWISPVQERAVLPVTGRHTMAPFIPILRSPRAAARVVRVVIGQIPIFR
jgi:hypothetical protein